MSEEQRVQKLCVLYNTSNFSNPDPSKTRVLACGHFTGWKELLEACKQAFSKMPDTEKSMGVLLVGFEDDDHIVTQDFRGKKKSIWTSGSFKEFLAKQIPKGAYVPEEEESELPQQAVG